MRVALTRVQAAKLVSKRAQKGRWSELGNTKFGTLASKQSLGLRKQSTSTCVCCEAGRQGWLGKMTEGAAWRTRVLLVM